MDALGAPGVATGDQGCQERVTVLEMNALLPQNPGCSPKPALPSLQAARPGRWARHDLGRVCAWQGLPPALSPEPGWGHPWCLRGTILVAGTAPSAEGRPANVLGSPWTKTSGFRQVFCIFYFSL